MNAYIFIIIFIAIILGLFVFIAISNWESVGEYIHYHEDTNVEHVHKSIGRGLTPEEYNVIFDPDSDGVDNF